MYFCSSKNGQKKCLNRPYYFEFFLVCFPQNLPGQFCILCHITQPAFTCSKLTTEALEQRCEICSKLTIKTPKRRYWRRFGVLRRFGVFIVNFEHISHLCSIVSIVNFEQLNAGCTCS